MKIEMPTWEQFMIPVLRYLEDGSTQPAREICEGVAVAVGLTVEHRSEMLKSGQTRYYNRILWALSYLARAEAVERPKRGSYLIADAGRALLASQPDGVRVTDLKQIPAFVEHVPVGRQPSTISSAETSRLEMALGPIEQIESGVALLEAAVASDLLSRIRVETPAFLERLVVELLVKMGFGGAEGKGTVLGGSGDGGIDGVIDQDALGLARIYVQAKRYASDNIVGRPDIQRFVGALHGNQANQGVFITTSGFSTEAVQYAESVNASVVLIDGKRLAELMVQYGVGVQTVDTYKVVEVDEDYFE